MLYIMINGSIIDFDPKIGDIMDKYELQKIKENFENVKIIYEYDLIKMFHKQYPNKEDKSYHYFLTDLYKNNILYRYDNNLLKPCGIKKVFLFSQLKDEKMKSRLESIEPPIYISFWQLSDLSRFMSLQSFVNIVFVETYYYATDVVANLLIDYGKKVVLENDYSTIIKYNRANEIYVIRKINEYSPINKNSLSRDSSKRKTMVVSPKIEKIIVDIIVDNLFDTILSDETYRILCEILKNYKINMATIKRYATKKHRWAGVKFAIESTGFNIEVGEFR